MLHNRQGGEVHAITVIKHIMKKQIIYILKNGGTDKNNIYFLFD